MVQRLLIDRMRGDKKDELQAYLDSNLPNPEWIEDILVGLGNVTSTENVLKLVRNDPSQTVRYCTTLAVGLCFVRAGLDVEFLDTEERRNFDLVAGGKLAVEVKLLDDISNWNVLSRRLGEIPSSYLVNVTAGIEITEPQVNAIVEDVRAAVSTHTEEAFEQDITNGHLSFVHVSTRRTLPMVSSGTFGVDLPNLRRLFSSRIAKAKEQLARSRMVKVAAIDVMRTGFFTDTPQDIFCGDLVMHFSRLGMRPLGSSRTPNGVLNEPSLWNGLDGILVFSGYNRGAIRIAHYANPSIPAGVFPSELGEPDGCDS